MNVRLEEWLDHMRQAQEPGPLVRVVIGRGGRGETWTFDVTDKTDLEDLAERMEATVRDANCRRCEMRAVDGEGRVIDHFIYRPEQAALAQVVGPTFPFNGDADPRHGAVPVSRRMTSALTAASDFISRWLRRERVFTSLVVDRRLRQLPPFGGDRRRSLDRRRTFGSPSRWRRGAQT
jgi:hypothetical protein